MCVCVCVCAVLPPLPQPPLLPSPPSLLHIILIIPPAALHPTVILGQSHYLLFYLVSAMQPRMLVTFNSDLEPLAVTVRVGQAVDVVGQAGKPKTITGFQTHSTPVLLSYGERAELATEECLYHPLHPPCPPTNSFISSDVYFIYAMH